MCLADLYPIHEPLPGLVPFPAVAGIQDVMGFKLKRSEPHSRFESDCASIICSAGVWEPVESRWQVRSLEREYCRVVSGEIVLCDEHGRRWTFAANSAFLLLRGFRGHVEVIHPTCIVYVVFSMPDSGALDWCTTAEGRTALGREKVEN